MDKQLAVEGCLNGISDKVKRMFYYSLATEVTLSTKIDNLGLDSLDLVELVMEFEKEFNLVIDESKIDLTQYKTIEDIVVGLTLLKLDR